MKLINSILLRKDSHLIKESVKQGKQYVAQGKLSDEDLKSIVEIDPTPTKKFVGWISKMWITERPDMDDLRNTIEEYNTFLNKGKAKTKDINQFKSFKDLKKEVDELNKTGAGLSSKDLESDYDTIVNNEDLLIMSPHTHEASRKLGLTHFAFRDCEGGGKDSAWCTTYKSPDHFNDYYYNRGVTFYYIKVKSLSMVEELKKAFPERYKSLIVTALAVLPGGEVDGYDGLDKQIKAKDVKKFTNIINIS